MSRVRIPSPAPFPLFCAQSERLLATRDARERGCRIATARSERLGKPAERVPDTEWIREATGRGEVNITRDGGIAKRGSAEITSVVKSGARCFILETGNATPLDYLRALMIAWPKILAIVETESPPFVFAIKANGRVERRYPPG